MSREERGFVKGGRRSSGNEAGNEGVRPASQPWNDGSDGSRGLDGIEDACLRCEASLVDLLDGALEPQQEARVRAHAAGCPGCGVLLRDAERGLAAIRLLHDAAPPVPEDLLGKILAKTARVPTLAEVNMEAYAVGNVLVFGTRGAPGQREARILMTAAMAFFSIALTLSLAGVRLGDLHEVVRSPASIGVSASRQFFDTKKQVVCFYDNLRVVREVEATVEEMRHSAESSKTKAPPPRLHPSAQRTLVSPDAMPALSRLVQTADERNTL